MNIMQNKPHASELLLGTDHRSGRTAQYTSPATMQSQNLVQRRAYHHHHHYHHHEDTETETNPDDIEALLLEDAMQADGIHGPSSSDNTNNSSWPTPIHPSRCPPLNLKFMWKLYHQRQNIRSLNHGQEEDEKVTVLRSQGFPTGLASLLLHHTRDHPLRIWLIDNSGTMHTNDGKIVTQKSEGTVEVVDCSRWQEVSTILQWHAELAAWVQTPMAVRFLRDPGAEVGPQQLGVSASKHHSAVEEANRLQHVLRKVRLTGSTIPVHYHLQELMPAIQALLPILEEERRRLVLCISTDSIPKDRNGTESPQAVQSFLLLLAEFLYWPVAIVFLLLTEDHDVVSFYKRLEDEHPLSVQVVENYVSECRKVQKHNPWLNYGYPLHQCREQGINQPVLEALSQRPLSPTEAVAALSIIFKQMESPDQLSYSYFRKDLELWNQETTLLWNPMKKRFVPWVDMKKLDKLYKESSSSEKCSIM